MSRKRILFVDNDIDFLDIRTQFLEGAGYDVIKACSLEQAWLAIEREYFQLALLDYRINDNDDPLDTSGGKLAADLKELAIPSMMLTGYPSQMMARKLMRLQPDGQPIALDCLQKDEPVEDMLQAIDHAFEHLLHINWNLGIDWKMCSPMQLAEKMSQHASGQAVLLYSQEIEDLLRKVFFDFQRIRIQRVLWEREGRAALAIYAFRGLPNPEPFMLVLGKRAALAAELENLNSLGVLAGRAGVDLAARQSTPHFYGAAYTLEEANMEEIQTLHEFLRSAGDKESKDLIDYLFETSLAAWHGGSQAPVDGLTMADLYRRCLGLESLSRPEFEEKVGEICRKAPVNHAHLEVQGDVLQVVFGQQRHSYPDPLSILFDEIFATMPAVGRLSPGLVSGLTILASPQGCTWLTDYSAAGTVPALWDYTCLESEIRFDWMSALELQDLFLVERILTGPEFSKLDWRDLEPPLKRGMKMIEEIRKLASENIGQDSAAYNAGILYQAVVRLAGFNPSGDHIPQELARLQHCLLAVAMIGEKLSAPVVHGHWDGYPELRLDPKTKQFMIGDSEISLRGNLYDLMVVLYHHAGSPVSNKDLYEVIWGGTYTHSKDQKDNITSTMRRLRAKLGDNFKTPQYVITYEDGYLLNPRPK